IRRLQTAAGDTLEYRLTNEGAHIIDVTVQAEKQGTGTKLLEEAIARIRAVNPKAIITGDLNSVGGVKLFARQAGARFLTRRGEKIGAKAAAKLAQAGEGPSVELTTKGAVVKAIEKFVLVGEEGGIRITKDGIRLTPKTERILALARDGKSVTRKEVLEAAAEEGISTSGRRQTMSTEALVSAMQGKRAMWERLIEIRKVITDAPRPSRQVLEDAATALARGPKATLKELRNAANKLGIRQAIEKLIVKPVQLTKKEFVELGKLRAGEKLGQLLEKETERLAELEMKAAKFAAGVDEKKILTREIANAVRKGTGEASQERAFADNILAEPGELIGTLTRVRQRHVWESLEDIAAGRFTTGELANIRRDVEMELRRVGKNADDVLASGEWASLGRRGGRVFEDTSMTTSEGGVFKLRTEAVEEADRVARSKVFAEGPVRDMMETADNMANFGAGRGGMGKGPP
ncbi:hypothetical protein LCGC14_2608630, partial [marine sediment metagenome]